MIKLFSALALLLVTTAQAATVIYPDKGGNVINLLDNNQFRQGKTKWAASGGTFSILTGSSALDGTASASWTPSAGSQTFKSTAVTVPVGLQGRTCSARVLYQTAETTNVYLMKVYDGSSNVLNNPVSLSGLSAAQEGFTTFPCPSSGTVQLSIEAPSSVPTNAILLTSTHLGSLLNSAQTSQATLVGGVIVTGCASQWSVTSSAFAAFGTQTGCTYTAFGAAMAPSTNVPGLKFASLSAGEYALEYEGGLNVGSGAPLGFYQFTDGTNTTREQSQVFTSTYAPSIRQTIAYTSSQSNITFQLYGKSSAGSIFVNGLTSNPGVFKLYRYPSSSETGLRIDQAAVSWNGISTLSATTSATSYGVVSTSLSGAIATSSSRNLTCSAAASTLGISCPLPKVGNYLVCYAGSFSNSVGTDNAYAKLVDGVGTQIIGEQLATSSTGSYLGTFGSCGVYTATSTATPTVFQLYGRVNGTSTGTFLPTSFSVTQLDGGQGAFYSMGGLQSNATNPERIERVKVSGATGAIVGQSGSWVSGPSGSSGIYTYTMPTGQWSATPYCVCTAEDQSGPATCAIDGESTTSFRLVERLANNPQNTSINYKIICMGPR